MYNDGFVSTTFWAYVACGIAIFVNPVVGILCTAAMVCLFFPAFKEIDKNDHEKYRRHKGYRS
jgi:hypothetical protein